MPGSFEHGIAIGRRLDERFGMHTTAAKMTDVPGHTIGHRAAARRAGLGFLHLGVNAASAVPDVPEFFVWRAPDGSEVVVNYAQSYGATELGVAVVPGGGDALHLAHTGDNHGPPSAEEVEALFARLQAEYPVHGRSPRRSTRSRPPCSPRATSLPVVEHEIGDSWIHGVASDPVLTARLRALLRLRAEWVTPGALLPGTPECDAFSDGLLLVPEHTWGKDLKTYLPDYVNYEKADFQRARAADVIDPDANPAAFDAVCLGVRPSDPSPQALSYSASKPRGRSSARTSTARSRPCRPSAAPRRWRRSTRPAPTASADSATAMARSTSPGPTCSAPTASRFGDDGAIDLAGRRRRARVGGAASILSRRTATRPSTSATRRAGCSEYCRDLDENAFWAVPDQSKPGLAIADRLPATVFSPASSRRIAIDGDDARDRGAPARAARAGVRRRGGRRATSGSRTGSRGRGRDLDHPRPRAARTRRGCPRRAGSASVRGRHTATGASQARHARSTRSRWCAAAAAASTRSPRSRTPARAGSPSTRWMPRSSRSARRRCCASTTRSPEPGRRLPRQPAQQRLGHELHDVVRRRPALPVPAGARDEPAPRSTSPPVVMAPRADGFEVVWGVSRLSRGWLEWQAAGRRARRDHGRSVRHGPAGRPGAARARGGFASGAHCRVRAVTEAVAAPRERHESAWKTVRTLDAASGPLASRCGTTPTSTTTPCGRFTRRRPTSTCSSGTATSATTGPTRRRSSRPS